MQMRFFIVDPIVYNINIIIWHVITVPYIVNEDHIITRIKE